MTIPISARKGPYGVPKFKAHERIPDWTKRITKLDVTGELGLMYLINAAEKEVINTDVMNWLEERVSPRAVDLPASKVFTNPGCTAAYGGSGSKGDMLYILLDAEDNIEFPNEAVKGNTIVLRVPTALVADTNAEVRAITGAGANAFAMAVCLLEDDDNGAELDSPVDIRNVRRLMIKSSAYSTGVMGPGGVVYQADPRSNFLQIIRTGCEVDGDIVDEETRETDGENRWLSEKADKLVLHGENIEGMGWYGVPWEGLEDGKRKTMSGGIFHAVRTFNPEGWFDYRTDPEFAGMAWADGGRKFLRKVFKFYSTYRPNRPRCIAGSQARWGIDDLQENGLARIEPGETKLGTATKTLVTVDGDYTLLTSKTFNREETDRNRMVFLSEDNIKYRFKRKRDTRFNHDPNSRSQGGTLDGEKGDWMTHCGLQLKKIQQIMVVDGVGLDSILS